MTTLNELSQKIKNGRVPHSCEYLAHQTVRLPKLEQNKQAVIDCECVLKNTNRMTRIDKQRRFNIKKLV